MNVCIVTLIFTLLTTISATAADREPITEYEQVLKLPQFNLSRQQLIAGEGAVQIFKIAEKGYLNPHIINKSLKSLNYPAFLPIREWLQRLSEIDKSTDINSIKERCIPVYNRLASALGLERMLVQQEAQICRQSTLHVYGKEAIKAGELTDEANQFIGEHLADLINEPLVGEFTAFVEKLANNSKIRASYSKTITKNVIEKHLIVPRKLLTSMDIDVDLTRHIQRSGFDPEAAKNIFYNEFSELISKAYKLLDSGADSDKIKQHLTDICQFQRANEERLPRELSLGRLNDLAKAVARKGHGEIARNTLAFIINNASLDIREEALFYSIWMYIQEGQYSEAMAYIKKMNLLSDKGRIMEPRLRFWIADVLENQNKKSEAITAYEKIIERHPLSYYSVLSQKKLQSMETPSNYKEFYSGIDKHNSPAYTKNELTEQYTHAIIRLQAWAKIDAKMFIAAEMNGLRYQIIPAIVASVPEELKRNVGSDLIVTAAAFIGKQENYLESFRSLYESIDKGDVRFNRFLLQTLYPVPYQKDLKGLLAKESIDHLVVLSLIRQESVFNPQARSPVGARGLMQLMPTTARQMRRYVRDHHLVNSKVNLELGTKYFKQLYKRYDGNLVYVLSSYNAGEARVARWKQQYFTSDSIIHNVENIPFLETRNYVKLIFRNLFFYKTLLENQNQDGPSFNRIYNVSLGFTR